MWNLRTGMLKQDLPADQDEGFLPWIRLPNGEKVGSGGKVRIWKH